MLPREHGAYGQLLFPLVTALAVGWPTVAAYGLAVAGIALFVAHEPLLVVMGQRGVRAEREQTRRAWRWLTGSVSRPCLAPLGSSRPRHRRGRRSSRPFWSQLWWAVSSPLAGSIRRP